MATPLAPAGMDVDREDGTVAALVDQVTRVWNVSTPGAGPEPFLGPSAPR